MSDFAIAALRQGYVILARAVAVVVARVPAATYSNRGPAPVRHTDTLPHSEARRAMDLLAAARPGFAGIDADPALKDRALQFLSAWLSHPDYAAYRPQLEWLVGAGKWSVLLDSFYQVI